MNILEEDDFENIDRGMDMGSYKNLDITNSIDKKDFDIYFQLHKLIY